MKEIITFDVYIDENDETGIDKVSLVKKPAIMSNFIAMSDQPELYRQVILSTDEKQIITGAALIPDLPIVRLDDNGDPYYIKYSADEIELILKKFASTKTAFNVNKDHKTDAPDVYIYEQWLTGKQDKTHDLGMDFPERTLMFSMKVDNKEIWDGIKSGKYKGFSIEGLFKFKRVTKVVKQEDITLEDLTDEELEEIYLYSNKNIFKVYQSVPNKGACDFCKMVAGKGWQRTELNFEGRPMLHENCKCSINVKTVKGYKGDYYLYKD